MSVKDPEKAPRGEVLAEDSSEVLFHALLRSLGRLRAAMEPYFAPFGISGPQWGALRVLSRAESAGDKGLQLSVLAERLLIRPPSVTAVVDRLERRGLVKRSLLRTDMRVRQVSLTPQGRQLVARVLVGHSQRICALFAGLAPQERQTLLEGLRKLDAHLVTLTNGIETQPED
jgi:DNA-binding MarR family transcriptional regulator